MTSKSSEDVLLIVNYVRHKKTDGILYLMGERMAWMVESKGSFSLSHLYADIKSQKISPDSKDKVQLQIVMHDSSAKTFHFINPKGREEAQKDRDGVKELLQQLLPKFRRQITSELEEKNRMLQESPELFQLYKDLVVSGVISAEEFWASRKEKPAAVKQTEGKQTIGVSAAFLADIKPQTDGCNGLKYNLTADIIESIFRTYPMVKKKHAEHVPHQMTESEFWTRFFQSHYFHRDRTLLSSKEIFSDCAKSDEKDIKDEITKKVSDPLLDLTSITDSPLGQGYGEITAEDTNKSSTSLTNLTMIRRFNHHSTMVLKACENESAKLTNGTDSPLTLGSTVNGKQSVIGDKKLSNGVNSLPRKSSETDFTDSSYKRARIREKLQYEDLEEKNHRKNVNLKLHKMEGYLHGPTPLMATKYTTSDDVIQASQSVTQEMDDWISDLTNVLSGSTALSVLGELSPGGALMHGASQQQLQHLVATDSQAELKTQYNALLELLRHFWNCFPVASKFLEEKLMRMKATLERYQMTKLNPLKERMRRQHYNIDLTGHMEELLAAAYTKYEAWQTKKILKRS